MSMKLFPLSVALMIIALVACTSRSPLPVVPNGVNDAPQQTLEKLPAELSIPHFRRMTLSGTALTFDRTIERRDMYTKYAISYRSNGLRITGVFLLPHGDGPYPLLIFNHGYIDPAVYTQGRGLKREEDFMVRQGFAVLHTDYRGHAGSDPSPMTDRIYDGNLEYAMDSANAILAVWEANLPSVDANTVGMLGHSLGGGVTLAILTGRPDLISAAVLYAPVHANVWENFVRWRADRDEGDRTIAVVGTPETHPAIWNNLSPQTFLGEITAPILLFHGSRDKDVPLAWSESLARALREHGKDVSYIAYDGEAHEFSARWQDFMDATVDFFRTQLLEEEWVPPLSPARITKKPFGVYVDPEHSPVQPEKFSGFHTGTDFEAREGETDVTVRAVCTGEVLEKKHVSGYGGVVIQRCTHRGEPVNVLYGHIRLSSVTQNVGDVLGRGQPFALLGSGFSAETDGERQHLHLGIYQGTARAVQGYVPSERELTDWVRITW